MLRWLKRKLGVAVIVPLRHGLRSSQEAVKLATMANQWQPHPSRKHQPIAFGSGVEHVWDECEGTLNACVIRFYNDKKKALDDLVLVTTDPDLKAKGIVTPDEQRPEIEPDYEQLKSGGWQLQKRRSTRDRQIVFYLLTGLLSYRLAQLLATTAAGSNFAGKTRCAIECEQLKSVGRTSWSTRADTLRAARR